MKLKIMEAYKRNKSSEMRSGTICKKLVVLLIAFMAWFNAYNVNAQMMTATDFVNSYNEFHYDNFFDYYNLTADGNILKISDNNDEPIMDIDCSKGYIEYDKSTDNSDKREIVDMLEQLIHIKLGYKQRKTFPIETLPYDNYLLDLYFYVDEKDTFYQNMNPGYYDTYGFYTEGCNDYGVCDYVKYSFDTDKFDYFYKTIEKIDDDNEENIKNLLFLKPTLQIDEINETSLKIHPQAAGENLVAEKNYCYIYRSTNRESGYARVNNDKINCSGGFDILDEQVESGETYYYIARLTYTNQYSDPISVTIPGDKVTTTKKADIDETPTQEETSSSTEKKTNPQSPDTGVYSHKIATIIVVFLCAFALIILKIGSKIGLS